MGGAYLVACIKLFEIKSSCEKSDLPPYALNCNIYILKYMKN